MKTHYKKARTAMPTAPIAIGTAVAAAIPEDVADAVAPVAEGVVPVADAVVSNILLFWHSHESWTSAVEQPPTPENTR